MMPISVSRLMHNFRREQKPKVRMYVPSVTVNPHLTSGS